MILCLFLEHPDAAVVAAITECVPRLAVEAGARIWIDARGLDLHALHARTQKASRARGVKCHAGASLIPVAAQLAASNAEAGALQIVKPGTERDFISAYPLTSLEIEDRILALLEGVGVSTCEELAALPREAVEVRFGAECVQAWRRARADDERRLF